MKIIDKIESRERCAEAGWYAWDFILDQPMDDDFILSLRPLGNFVYLQMLSKPFFKIESDYRFIKGLRGDNFFRVAVHDAYRDKLDEVEALVAGYHDNKMI
ncbi:MAG: hypothetical protein IJJ60_14235 [Clostridia bacterium]|nr:hypothetical protein [Clostridia bacterium]